MSYFDYIVVDARKPLFFGEGTTIREVDRVSTRNLYPTIQEYHQRNILFPRTPQMCYLKKIIVECNLIAVFAIHFQNLNFVGNWFT